MNEREQESTAPRLRRRWRGYDRHAVERVLARMASDQRAIARERDDLEETVERLRTELAAARQRIEELAAPASVPDEDPASADRELLEEEVRRLKELRSELHSGYRAFLLAALELLESSDPAADGSEATPGSSDTPGGTGPVPKGAAP